MERYGKIPDKYTKEWWDYIWYYYKWRFIGTAIAIFLVVITVVQCASRINYDAEICYLGNIRYTDEAVIEQLCADLGEIVSDVNENGKKQVQFRQLIIGKEGTPESLTEYNEAMLTKAALEFQTGESYLYLFSYEELHRVVDRDTTENVFVDPHEFAPDVPDEKMDTDKDGDFCAVLLDEDNEFLVKYNLTAEPMYLAVRNMREKDKKKDEEQEKYRNAIEIVNYILN